MGRLVPDTLTVKHEVNTEPIADLVDQITDSVIRVMVAHTVLSVIRNRFGK